MFTVQKCGVYNDCDSKWTHCYDELALQQLKLKHDQIDF